MKTPTKEDLILDLDDIAEKTIIWFRDQTTANFNKEILDGKWTMAGHLYHLIKTTQEIGRGMSMPRIVLRTTFGKSNRAERTFEEQHKKYIEALANFKATTRKGFVPSDTYLPPSNKEFDREELLQQFSKEIAALQKTIGKWKEKDLGIYILPHPAMGKLTIREIIYFSIFHTKHHLDNLKEHYVI